MSHDIKIYWREFDGDLGLLDGDLAGEDELTTAVILSLFLDARARDDDVLPSDPLPSHRRAGVAAAMAGENNSAVGDKRGWWADTLTPDNPDNHGSRLWLLSREKQLSTVLIRAKTYAAEALAWLTKDHIATKVDVETSIPKPQTFGIDITITLPDGNSRSYEFMAKV